jgi:hypothetical protein
MPLLFIKICFQKGVSAILYLFSGKIFFFFNNKVHFSTEISSFSCPWIRIRIPNMDTDPDPQSHGIQILSGSTTLLMVEFFVAMCPT